MQHGAIENSNLTLRGNGADIHDLHARWEHEDGWIAITTAWMPTPAEIARINRGMPVYVTLLTNEGFPPMRVEVKK